MTADTPSKPIPTSEAKNDAPRQLPRAGLKLVEALRQLMKEKDFNSITTAEIARTAGANEALIYRYFKDKRGLLHHLLSDYLDEFITQMELDMRGVKGAVNKLRKLIWSNIFFYSRDLVFAKILLLEVRNFPGYFESDTYKIVKYYASIITNIVREGMAEGEIRDDISPARIRQIILGSIEHLCLPMVIFGHDIDTDLAAEEISEVIFGGILKH